MKTKTIQTKAIDKNNHINTGQTQFNNMPGKYNQDTCLAIALILDIGTEKTGYSIWKQNNNNWFLDTSGYIWVKKTAKTNKTAQDRYPEMITKISQLLKLYTYTHIIVEGTYYSKSFTSIEYPLKIHGFIESYCVLHNICFNSVKPQYWRKLLQFPKDKRAYLKEYSLTYIKNHYPTLNVKIDDEADAICIGEAMLHNRKE